MINPSVQRREVRLQGDERLVQSHTPLEQLAIDPHPLLQTTAFIGIHASNHENARRPLRHPSEALGFHLLVSHSFSRCVAVAA